MTVVKFLLLMFSPSHLGLKFWDRCSTIRCVRRHESCELAFEGLAYASAPALSNGLGRGIGEDVLVPFFQAIEDALRRGFGRGLRYIEATVHVGVDGADEDGVDRHALRRQHRSQ